MTPGTISIDDFATRVEPLDITVKVVRYDKKYIGQSQYVIQLEIENGWEVYLETKKSYEDWKAFH